MFRIIIAIAVAVCLAGDGLAQITNHPASTGNSPSLAAQGDPTPGEEIVIEVGNASGGIVYLFFGLALSQTPTPFGILELTQAFILPTFNVATADAAGVARFEFTWPEIGPGFPAHCQALIVTSGPPLLTNAATYVSQTPVTTVAGVSPADGEPDVALTRETIVTFSRAIDPSSVNDQSVRATFAGQPLDGQLHVGADALSVTLFHDAPLPASSVVRVTIDGDELLDTRGNAVDADGDGTFGGLLEVDYSTVDVVPLAGTSVYGRVFASALSDGGTNVPLEGVTVYVDGVESTVFCTTDAMGNFNLDPAPVGTFFVHIDGSTATNTPPGWFYPNVGKAWTTVANEATSVGDIHLPAVTQGTLQPVSNTVPTTIQMDPAQVASVTDPTLVAALNQTEITVPGGSLFANDGTVGGMVGIAPVAPDRLPGTLPPGLDLAIVITVQTDGATNFDEPVAATFPNLPDPGTGVALPAGSKTALWSFDHDQGRFVIVGSMTVSADGMVVTTDPGVGIVAPGWHGPARGSQPGKNRVSKLECFSGFLGATGGCALGFLTLLPGYETANCLAGVLGITASVASSGPSCGGFFGFLSCFANAIGCLPGLSLFGAVTGCLTSLIQAGQGCIQPSPQLLRNQAYFDAAYDLCEEALGSTVWLDAVDPFAGDPTVAMDQINIVFETLVAAVDPASPSGETIDAAEEANLLGLPLPVGITPTDVTVIVDYFNETTVRWGSGVFSHAAAGATNFVDAPSIQTHANAMAAAAQAFVNAGDAFIDPFGASRDYYELLYDVSDPVITAPSLAGSDRVYYKVELPGGVVQRGLLTGAGLFRFAAWVEDSYVTISYVRASDLDYAVQPLFTAGVGDTSEIPPVFLVDPTGVPDTDGDGLHDIAEDILGTDVADPDTDGDGVPDGAEVQNATDPLDGLAIQTGIVATVDTPGNAVDVAAFDDVIAVADAQQGLSVFNAFNGMDPVVVAQVDTPGAARRVAFTGSLVAVADGLQGLAIVDVSDPPAANILHQLDLGTSIDCVATSGPVCYAGGQDGTLHVVDMVQGVVLDQLSVNGSIEDIGLEGDVLCVISEVGPSGLLNTFQLVGRMPVPQGQVGQLGALSPNLGGRRVFVGGGFAYPTRREGYMAVDLANPAAPVLTGSPTSTIFGFKHIVLNGSGLGLAAVDGNSDLTGPQDVSLYDTSDPTDVEQLLVTYATPGIARAAAVFNGRGYVADGPTGLSVLQYTAFDTLGVAPTINLSSTLPLTGAEENQLMRLTAAVADDVQVRNVEFRIDGVLVASDGGFPFELAFVTPSLATQSSVQIEAVAFDTGGNSTSTGVITVPLVVDSTPPLVHGTAPADTGQVAFVDGVDTLFAFFDGPVDPASLDDSSFSLVFAGPDGVLGNGDDVTLTGATFAVDAASFIATATYAPALAPGLYQASLSTAVADLAGNALALPHTWTFDVIDGDADGDGLSDADEVTIHGSDPHSADTDGDGLTDDYEVLVLGTDPTLADTDGDGATDDQEVAVGSDPLTVDVMTTLQGSVDDAGAPVGGALVRVVGPGAPLFSTVSAPDGSFSITPWPSSVSPVACSALFLSPGGALSGASAPVATVPGGITNIGPIAVTPAAGSRLLACEQTTLADAAVAAATGDVNGDGLPDVTVACPGASAIEILATGSPTGLLSLGTVATPATPSDVALVDLDGDGEPDLVATFGASGEVGVALGLGGGSFGAFTLTSVGGTPGAIAAGLLNGDGFADIACCDATSDEVIILSGDGAGGFGAPIPVAVGGGPVAIAAADLDGTAGMDLVTANAAGGTISILVSTPPGFTVSTIPAGPGVASVESGDLTGDGNTDVVAAGPLALHLFLGDGAGGLALADTAAAPQGPHAVAVGNLDVDLALEVVVTNRLGDDVSVFEVSVGQLTAPTRYGAGPSPRGLVVTDIDGDGSQDVVTLDADSPTLTALAGRGDGTLAGRVEVAIAPGLQSVAAADFNGDGILDVATASAQTGDVSVALGLGGAALFAPPVSYPVGTFPDDLAVGDLNSDGRPDLVTADFGSDTVSVLFGQAGGTFAAALAFVVGSQPRAVLVADATGDGEPDILTADSADGTLSIIVNLGGGAFGATTTLAAGIGPRDVVVGDFDDDGIPDVACANAASNDVSIFTGTGAGAFTPGLLLPTGLSPFALAVADLDGDGRDDLAVAHSGSSSLGVRLGQGAFGLGPATSLGLTIAPRTVATVDLDGDGAVDLVTSSSQDLAVAVLLGDGQGSFAAPRRFSTGGARRSLAIGDLDGDGFSDVLLDALTYLRNILAL